MKTRPYKRITWLVAGMSVLLAAGCGSPPGASADSATNSAAAAASSPSNPTTAVSTNASGTAAAPADSLVRRSERARRILSPRVEKIVQLVEAGAGEEITRGYVGASTQPYELDLDTVLYLRDIGVPDGVVAAMMRRDSEIREKQTDAATLQANFETAVKEIKETLATSAPAAPAEPASTDPAASTDGAPPALPPQEPVVATGAAPPPDAPQEVQQFYSDLAPYGSWYQVPAYGWVWQPSAVTVSSTWAPYCNGGSWMWTNHGWYWRSDYSWGWAPFHYGRWGTYPGLGWCWTPGTVWGPVG